jgi:Holliday junction resolvase RusA-like endonuclease
MSVTTYLFTIDGEITPYARRTHRGKHSARARRYHASQNRIAWQLKAQMQVHGWPMLPSDEPLEAVLHAHIAKRFSVKDADNLLKATLDAAQGVVFPDDRQIWDKTVRKRSGSRDRATLVISTREEA